MAANRDESTDFGWMKVAQLKEFLSARLFSGDRFQKDELIALCQQVQQLNVDPAPMEEEQLAATEVRLEEIHTVSPITILPLPTDEQVELSSSYSEMPNVTLVTIYEYSALTPSLAITAQSLKSYKALATYRNVQDRSVRNVQVSVEFPGGWVYLKAEVRGSMRSLTWYKVWSLMNKATGTICGCQCNCAARRREACSHATSLLFLVMMVTDNGLNKPPCPTDDSCAWLQPHTKNASGSRVADLFSKYDRKTQAKPRLDWVRPIMREDLKRKLQTTYSSSRLLKQFRVSMNEVLSQQDASVASTSTSAHDSPPPPSPVAAPPTLDAEAGAEVDLIRTREVAAPMRRLVASYQSARGIHVDDGAEVLAVVKRSVNEDVSECTEQATTTQSEVQEWSDLRWGRITASTAHPVRTYMGSRGGFW